MIGIRVGLYIIASYFGYQWQGWLGVGLTLISLSIFALCLGLLAHRLRRNDLNYLLDEYSKALRRKP